jgi:hypothetical protein
MMIDEEHDLLSKGNPPIQPPLVALLDDQGANPLYD